MQYNNLSINRNDKRSLSLSKNTLGHYLWPLIVFFCVTIINGCQSSGPKTVDMATITPGEKKAASESQLESFKRAISALDNKKYDQAKSLFVELTEERPDLAGPWANLGLLELRQKNIDKAEKYLNIALKINPEMSEALNLMGLLATHKRQIKVARDYYLSAIKYKADYSNAHYNLALLYDIYLQNIDKATFHYRKYLKLTNNQDKETLSWVEQLEASLKQ